MNRLIASFNHERVVIYLSTVDEFGQRNIGVVAKDVDILKVSGGSILELDAEEVANIGGRATAELNGDGRGKIG